MSAARRAEERLGAALSTRRGRGVAALLLFAVVSGLLLLRLGTAPIDRRAEQRTWSVAAHMIASGDWLVPVMDERPRVKKPPLYYWLGAGAGTLRGELTPFALRLPAALAALGLLAVVLCWGMSIGGSAAGGIAALSLLCMAQFWSLGRRGVAEIPLALCAALALFLFDRIYWGGRRRLLPLFFAVSLLGFLTKATAALLVIGAPIVVQLAHDRAFRRLWRADLAVASLLTLLGSLAWYAAIWWRVPEGHQVLREALLLPLGLSDAETAAGHVRPFWFHLQTLPAAAAPVFVFAPLALLRVDGRPAALADPRTRFTTLGFVTLFLAFSALPMKQKHYMTPLLPLLAVAMGVGIARVVAARRALVLAGLRRLAPLFAMVVPVLALLASAHLWLAREGALAVLVTALLMLGAAATGHVAGRSGLLRLFALSFLAVTLVAFTWTEASFDVWRARFHAASVPAEDAPYWQGVFERRPALRQLYRARDWEPARAVSAASPPSPR